MVYRMLNTPLSSKNAKRIFEIHLVRVKFTSDNIFGEVLCHLFIFSTAYISSFSLLAKTLVHASIRISNEHSEEPEQKILKNWTLLKTSIYDALNLHTHDAGMARLVTGTLVSNCLSTMTHWLLWYQPLRKKCPYSELLWLRNEQLLWKLNWRLLPLGLKHLPADFFMKKNFQNLCKILTEVMSFNVFVFCIFPKLCPE